MLSFEPEEPGVICVALLVDKCLLDGNVLNMQCDVWASSMNLLDYKFDATLHDFCHILTWYLHDALILNSNPERTSLQRNLSHGVVVFYSAGKTRAHQQTLESRRPFLQRSLAGGHYMMTDPPTTPMATSVTPSRLRRLPSAVKRPRWRMNTADFRHWIPVE